MLPFTPDAWMDRTKDKIGCEFPFTKLFYVYRPLRSLDAILKDIEQLDKEADEELNRLSSESHPSLLEDGRVATEEAEGNNIRMED